MRLANTVGTRINEFDELEWFDQTVETFNTMFPECPIKDDGMTSWIEIGSPASNNCREIRLFEHQDSYNIIKHKMYSDVLYTINKEDYFLDERETELVEINGVLT